METNITRKGIKQNFIQKFFNVVAHMNNSAIPVNQKKKIGKKLTAINDTFAKEKDQVDQMDDNQFLAYFMGATMTLDEIMAKLANYELKYTNNRV